MRKCKDWGQEISSWKYQTISRPVLVSLEHRVPSLRPELPRRVFVEGQQLQRHRLQSLQRQMANVLVAVVQSLTNALGKSQFVVDRTRAGPTTVKRAMGLSWRIRWNLFHGHPAWFILWENQFSFVNLLPVKSNDVTLSAWVAFTQTPLIPNL